MPALGVALLGGLASAAIALAEHVARGQLAAWKSALSLGFASGAAGGLALGLSLCLLRGLSPPWRLGLWASLGAAAGVLLAAELGALARLSGPYLPLALGVLAASVLGGAISAGALGTLAGERWRSLGLRLRLGAAALLVLVVVAASAANLWLFPDGYRSAHEALSAVAWLYLVGLMVLLWPGAVNWRGHLAAGATLGCAVLAAVAFTASRSPSELSLLSRAPATGLPLRGLRGITDVDRDGYSGLFGEGDCAPRDRRIHPGAREIPGNGVDDNCAHGDAPPRAAAGALAPVPAERSPVSVVLVTVEAMRVDRVRLGEDGASSMPRLARWARGARVYQRAYTAGGLTTLSLASLHHGVYPSHLRWTAYTPQVSEASARGGRHAWFRVAPDEPTRPLAWWLRRRGLYTAAVIDDGDVSDLISRELFSAGFDEFHAMDDAPAPRRNDDCETADVAVSVLERLQARGAPFFLWVHFYGPHGPPPPVRACPLPNARGDEYDQCLAYADLQLGRLLDQLDRGDRASTLAIVTADHGESLGPSGLRGHGGDMSEGATAVPLVVSAPGVPPGATRSLVSLVDLFPTILNATRTPAPSGLDGLPLSPTLDRGTPPRTLVVESFLVNARGRCVRNLAGFTDGQRKLVVNRLERASWGVDLTDPSETAQPAADPRFAHLVAAAGRLEDSRVESEWTCAR